MEILSLYVKDCGPLRELELDFSDGNGRGRPITLLAGANGSGKTTVLELCAALFEGILRPVQDSDILSRTKATKAQCFDFDNPFSLIYSDTFIEELQAEKELSPVDLHGPVKVFTRDINQAQLLRIAFKHNDLSEYAEQKVANLPSVLYLPYRRFIHPVQGDQIHREETKYRLVYRYHAPTGFAGSLDSYLIWLEYAEPETFEKIRSFLNALYPRKRFGVDRKNLKAMVTLDDGSSHPVDLLSSGEQNLLIVLLEIRRRITPGGIVLIDEIENSLHPAFQHRMAQGLFQLQKETPFQLIATSHSPEMLRIFGAENTLILTEF